jgi:hypothetical protein
MILLQIHHASNIEGRAPRSLRSFCLTHHSFRVAFVLLPLALFISGCSDSDDDNFTPTAPEPTITTETFEGTVTINGAITHSFTVTAPSTVTATLTAVSTGAEAVIGLSLGTWNGEYCQIVLANDAAVQGKFVVGIAQTAGNFCIRLYDVGRFAGPTGYQVTVSHQ